MSLIKRSIPIKQYLDYRSYKKLLRLDFNHQCAYCSVREPELGGSKSFHIDHYKPKKLFPNKINDYLNLFYTCRDCNTYKGDYWHSALQFIFGRFILNPCDHDLEEHYDSSQVIWKSKSRAGAWNLEKLNLNSASQQRRRQTRESIKKTIVILEENKAALLILIEKGKIEEKQYIIDKYSLSQKLIEIEQMIIVQKSLIEGPLD